MTSIIMGILAVVWVLAGIAAFIYSIVCFGRNSDPLGYNIAGLLIAILFGPFYWLYFIFARGKDGYCTQKKTLPI